MTERATHLPILEGLCNLITPRKMLQFGGGEPFLLSLPVEQVMVALDHVCDVNDFDLVLIDGPGPPDSERTIRYVLGQHHPPVVIHDAEVREYRRAIRDLSEGRSIMFCIEKPHTALVWPEGWEQDPHEVAMEVSRCMPSETEKEAPVG